MKSLVDTMHDFGYQFGIHDQYRDYYHAAPSYDENYACRLVDGTVPGHSHWQAARRAIFVQRRRRFM